jgi:Holliday junction resolvase RusA-like endonuclease
VSGEGLRFVVYGTPATKGSMKAVPIGRGRHAVVESHTTAKPWREAVKSAARDAMAELEGTGDPFATLSGPVEVDVVYSFRKPKSAPRRRRIWPITRSSGDVDKLARNVLDALVDVGVMGDDSQVVRLVGEKAYCGEAPSTTDVPSARIIVRPLPAAVRAEQLDALVEAAR